MKGNTLTIVGKVAQTAETKNTTNSSVTKISVAWNKNKKVGDNWESEPHFFDVKAWGEEGKLLEGFAKGQNITVHGWLAYESWETSEGGKRSKLVIMAEDFSSTMKPLKGKPAEKPAPKDNSEEPF